MIDPEILLAIKDLFDDNNSKLINELNDIKTSINEIKMITVKVKNGTEKTYTMTTNEAIQNIYNDISDIKHDIESIKTDMPEKSEKVIKRFSDKFETFISIIRNIFYALGTVGILIYILREIVK